WQFGQVHLVVVAAAAAAMVAFDRRRDAAGGALLGLAIAVKIFPALLLVVLAVQRRWRAVAATLVAVLALFLLALLVLGWGTMSLFLREHLPAVASGRAFPNALGNLDNHSVFGLTLALTGLVLGHEH